MQIAPVAIILLLFTNVKKFTLNMAQYYVVSSCKYFNLNNVFISKRNQCGIVEKFHKHHTKCSRFCPILVLHYSLAIYEQAIYESACIAFYKHYSPLFFFIIYKWVLCVILLYSILQEGKIWSEWPRNVTKIKCAS